MHWRLKASYTSSLRPYCYICVLVQNPRTLADVVVGLELEGVISSRALLVPECSIFSGAHLLYWYKSTCFLAPKYLLTGTKVQILTPEEQRPCPSTCRALRLSFTHITPRAGGVTLLGGGGRAALSSRGFCIRQQVRFLFSACECVFVFDLRTR